MISLKDIASECGVSVATVSKALNGQSDIGEETKRRVIETANRLGYVPNAVAKALKTDRTHNIGVLFVDEAGSGLTHDYFSFVLDSFKRGAEEKGYDITFISNNKERPGRTTYLEHARFRRFDGVCIACVDFTNPEVLELVSSEIPVVTIDHIFNNTTAVISDNIGGMKSLAQYIFGRGHRRVAYIHGEKSAVTTARLAAFHRVAEEYETEIPDEYVREAPYRDTKGAYRETKALLDLPTP
ncbi:MAG: LacI family DNA-binding transcriptional regulator, partial [Lachnospiraceae bacterium]|nr:LacI family DNA-binding transcriptional regulator [Lachnospiraceae bacterium]